MSTLERDFRSEWADPDAYDRMAVIWHLVNNGRAFGVEHKPYSFYRDTVRAIRALPADHGLGFDALHVLGRCILKHNLQITEAR